MLSRTELQIIGGGLYLLNKVFLDLMERRRGKESFWLWRKLAWAVYLLGLPPILLIFYREHNWIFFAAEAGGAPSMLYGLVAAFRRRDAPKWLDVVAAACVPLGIGYSFLDLGFSRFTQVLEFCGIVGFLLGTYLLAKDMQAGYKWFFLMNAATAWLMYEQGYHLFVPQQILSVLFILDAYRVRKRHDAAASSRACPPEPTGTT